jgi:hypothetical protein
MPVELLAQDIATIRIRDIIKDEARSALQTLGLVVNSQPPPFPPKRQKPAHLRLVEPQPDDSTSLPKPAPGD